MADTINTDQNDTQQDDRNMEALQKLKKEGNQQYSQKNYTSALDFYAQAVQSVEIDAHLKPPSSLINGTNIEFYKEILNKIELNTFLKGKRIEISKIFSNRAACYLNLKQFIECIHSCNISLLYHPNNENALYRRSLSYEYLKKYSSSLKNYQKLLQINPKHAKAIKGMNRIQAIIAKQTDRLTVYTDAIDALRACVDSTDDSETKDGNKIISHIGVVMNEICETTEHHSQIINELGFTHILHHMLLSDKYTKAIRNDCVHALNGIINKITDNDKYSQEDQLLVLNAFQKDNKQNINYVQSLIKISTSFLTKLVAICEKQDDKDTKDIFDNEKDGLFIKLLVQYMIHMASNQYLTELYSDDILQHLLQYFKRLKYKYIQCKSQQTMNKFFKSSSKAGNTQMALQQDKEAANDTRIISDILVSILKHLSAAALRNNTTNYKLLEKIRYTFFYQFLFTDFSQDLRIKNEILRYFVCCSGLKSVFDQVNDTKLASLKTKYEQRISEALKGPIRNALKAKEFTSANVRLVKALRGLSIILQSNHKLGEEIASNEDVLNCIVEVATINDSQTDHEYKTDKEIMNEFQQYNKKKKVDFIGYLGCEVLALSCSNGAIRKAIIKSNNQHVFAWILDSDDFMVRAYAANALSKFAAIDEDSRELALGGNNKCLVCCCGIIHHLLHNEEEEEKKKEDDDDDEFRNYKLPLMNLCVETISYLSLHIESKLGLISNENEMLKLLVSISSTRYFEKNRSLRHGLLTIVLNCCLSKQDVTRFMSDKEEQLHALKKAVSKSLPNDPTKEDDIIQSRAGDQETVKKIQRELIKENCIYLIYQTVKFTRKENRKIDDYIAEEIGMKEEDEIRIKLDAEQRRKDRLHWNPDKRQNETEKEKLARKKLHHLSTQKTKYKSFELEEKLQMKICQVLMMISNIAEFRGHLVRQKAVRLSMDLFFENKHKMKSLNVEIRQMACVTIARICISINPILLNINDISPICACLLKLIDEAQHELYIYEALLSLCNIASLPNSDDIKIDIVENKHGWHTLRNAFEDEHDLINAAILEIWCNLCTCYEAGIMQLYKNRKVDIQIVTLFLRHDSRRIQSAAVSILAIATSIIYDEEEDEHDISKEIAVEIAKNGGVLLLQCLINIRQSTLIERFNKNKEEEKKNQQLDRVILERVRMVMANLEQYGFHMRNIEKHGVNKDVQKDFRKALNKLK